MKKLLALAFLLLAIPAIAAEYHVCSGGNDTTCNGSANATSSAAPNCCEATIQACVNDLSAAGDICTIHAGTYAGAVTIPATLGTVGSNFILRGDPAAATSAAVITGLITFAVPGVSAPGYWTLRHFKLGKATTPMITITKTPGASSRNWKNVTVDDILVTSIPAQSTEDFMFGCGGGSSGWGSAVTNWIWTNMNVSNVDNGNSNTNVVDLFEWYMGGATWSDSTYKDVGGRIMLGSSQTGNTFDGNIFKNIDCHSTTGEGDGCIQGYNQLTLTVDNNVFDDVGAGDEGDLMLGIVNNRTTSSPSTSSSLIRHNTFISSNASGNSLDYAVYATGGAGAMTIQDNIFIQFGTTSDPRGGPIAWHNACPSSKTLDHNLYYDSDNSSTIRDISDVVTGCGGHNAYGTGDLRNSSPATAGGTCTYGSSGCVNPGPLTEANGYQPAAGSPVCDVGTSGSDIGAIPCAGGGSSDTVAPNSISTLAVSAPAKAPQLGAVLSWTAPADSGTGSTGSAASYFLVGKGAAVGASAPTLTPGSAGSSCSGSDGAGLTAVLNSSGVFVTTLPTPRTAGLAETWTVKGLRPNHQYAFALCSLDASPNQSSMSNVVNITTPKFEGYGYQSAGGGFTGSTAPSACNVTSLSDSGLGSLRTCMGSNTYIGFSVGGTINLLSRLDARNLSSYTVDGSTAPSPGITIQSDPTAAPTGINDMINLGGGSHVIWDYLRVTGKKTWPSGSASNTDLCFMVAAPTAGTTLQHLVLSRLTIRNCGDSAWDMYDQVQDASLGNNFIVFNQHPQTTGRPGATNSTNMSWYRNLWAHNGERQPQLLLAHTNMDLRNNVHYDWSYGNSLGSYAIRIRNSPAGSVSANIVNNTFIAGTNTGAIHYGTGLGCDAEEGTCAGCAPQAANGTAGTPCLTTTMGEIWFSGNSFSAGVPADTYSTVAAERSVTANAAVTTVAASALCNILTDVGTHYPISDETAAIGDAFTAMSCSGGAVCGDALVNGGEVCDGANLNSQTCITQGFAGGTLSCSANCLSFNVSLCQIEAGKSATAVGVTCSGCTIQ